MSDDALADLYGGPLDVRNSIFANLEKGLTRNSNGLATIVMHQPADHLSELVTGSTDHTSKPTGPRECLKWTFSEVHRAALQMTAGLMARGIKPGMRVVTLFPNRVEFPLMLWMTTILRLTLCPLDPGALTEPRREELANLMALIKPDVVVVPNQVGAQALEAVFNASIAANARSPKVKMLLDEASSSPSHSDWKPFKEVATSATLSKHEEQRLLQDARTDDPDREALILFTSGTSSGQPKGCPRHVGSTCHVLFSQIYGVRGFDNSSRILQSTANFRIIACSVTLHAWQNGAATVIPDPGLGVKGSIAAIREHKITYVLLIPALLHAMVAEPEFASLDVSSVGDVQLGGEITTRDVFNKASRSFPHAYICNGHGMSEGGGMFKWPFKDTPPEEIPFINDICPLGNIAPGARLRIQDPENPHGRIMKRGEIGELVCACNSIIKRYLGDVFPETFFTNPERGIQWFRTGDLATITPSGLVYILGRAKDRIKRAGVPILPAALENCIEKFTGTQTAVVAYPHPVLGQEPLAVVRDWSSGKTEEEVKEEVLRKFGKDYALGPVVSLEELRLPQFPLNATGKVMKLELVRRAQDVLGR